MGRALAAHSAAFLPRRCTANRILAIRRLTAGKLFRLERHYADLLKRILNRARNGPRARGCSPAGLSQSVQHAGLHAFGCNGITSPADATLSPLPKSVLLPKPMTPVAKIPVLTFSATVLSRTVPLMIVTPSFPLFETRLPWMWQET